MENNKNEVKEKVRFLDSMPTKTVPLYPENLTEDIRLNYLKLQIPVTNESKRSLQ